MPLSLHDDAADFAAWCSYKYLNAGPGAVGGAFIHRRHLRDAALPRLAGWWGHDPATRFRMQPGVRGRRRRRGLGGQQPARYFRPRHCARRCRCSQHAGMAALRAKSIALTGWLERQLQQQTDDALTDHHSGRAGPARLSAVAAPARDAAARPRSCSRRWAAAAWCATGASPTSSGWRRCRSTTASWTCCAPPCAVWPRSCGTERHMPDFTLIGAGPVGTLMALMLANRGHQVRAVRAPARSAHRAAGARPLDQSGHGRPRPGWRSRTPDWPARLAPLLMPMPGRMLHEEHGRCSSCVRQKEHEVIYAVSREQLNRVLIEAAAECPRHRTALRHALSGCRPGHRHRAVCAMSATDEESTETFRGAARRRWRQLRRAHRAGRSRAAARAGGAAGSRLQGVDHPAQAREARVDHGAAYLATRRLHADRTAEYGRQLHCHAVPAAPG